jgi:hypothetical protein
MGSTQSKPGDEALADQAVWRSATHSMHELALGRCLQDRETVAPERISALCFLEGFDKLPIDQEQEEPAVTVSLRARRIR